MALQYTRAATAFWQSQWILPTASASVSETLQAITPSWKTQPLMFHSFFQTKQMMISVEHKMDAISLVFVINICFKVPDAQRDNRKREAFVTYLGGELPSTDVETTLENHWFTSRQSKKIYFKTKKPALAKIIGTFCRYNATDDTNKATLLTTEQADHTARAELAHIKHVYILVLQLRIAIQLCQAQKLSTTLSDKLDTGSQEAKQLFPVRKKPTQRKVRDEKVQQ